MPLPDPTQADHEESHARRAVQSSTHSRIMARFLVAQATSSPGVSRATCMMKSPPYPWSRRQAKTPSMSASPGSQRNSSPALDPILDVDAADSMAVCRELQPWVITKGRAVPDVVVDLHVLEVELGKQVSEPLWSQRRLEVQLDSEMRCTFRGRRDRRHDVLEVFVSVDLGGVHKGQDDPLDAQQLASFQQPPQGLLSRFEIGPIHTNQGEVHEVIRAYRDDADGMKVGKAEDLVDPFGGCDRIGVGPMLVVDPLDAIELSGSGKGEFIRPPFARKALEFRPSDGGTSLPCMMPILLTPALPPRPLHRAWE